MNYQGQDNMDVGFDLSNMEGSIWWRETASAIVMIIFFMLWNGIMSGVMTMTVFAPWSRGECEP